MALSMLSRRRQGPLQGVLLVVGQAQHGAGVRDLVHDLRPTRGMSDGSVGRLRPLTVPIFGQPRLLGSIPTSLHTDARTLLIGLLRDANGKGKSVELPPDRAAA